MGANSQAVFKIAYENKELDIGVQIYFSNKPFYKRALLLKESENNKVRLTCRWRTPGNQLQQQYFFPEVNSVTNFTGKFRQIYVNLDTFIKASQWNKLSLKNINCRGQVPHYPFPALSTLTLTLEPLGLLLVLVKNLCAIESDSVSVKKKWKIHYLFNVSQ